MLAGGILGPMIVHCRRQEWELRHGTWFYNYTWNNDTTLTSSRRSTLSRIEHHSSQTLSHVRILEKIRPRPLHSQYWTSPLTVLPSLPPTIGLQLHLLRPTLGVTPGTALKLLLLHLVPSRHRSSPPVGVNPAGLTDSALTCE